MWSIYAAFSTISGVLFTRTDSNNRIDLKSSLRLDLARISCDARTPVHFVNEWYHIVDSISQWWVIGSLDMCMTERGSGVFVFEPKPTWALATTDLTAGAMKPLSDRVAAWPPRNYNYIMFVTCDQGGNSSTGTVQYMHSCIPLVEGERSL